MMLDVTFAWTNAVGSVAACCTTLCWIPQAWTIIQKKRTDGVSLATQSFFTLGVALWAFYGLFLHSWPILLANVTTLVLSGAILFLKLRYPSPPDE
jgi:MtN3 and saliva related transmembrane protein